jgi:hypothetical protein
MSKIASERAGFLGGSALLVVIGVLLIVLARRKSSDPAESRRRYITGEISRLHSQPSCNRKISLGGTLSETQVSEPTETQDTWGTSAPHDTVAINKIIASNAACKRLILRTLAEREGFEY